IVTSGPFQSVSAAPADNAAITFKGTANTGYAQNLFFHKNAFSLVMVPMAKPPGAVDVGSETYKGLSVRVIPYYDGTNDVSNWRLDILYGTKTIDKRLAVRASGS
ncbi:MAG TPA: P22 phage major capsid protein family protein, partial [Kaistia sp.]|nr:P22 phage major capsid protein family protein [Kaistia sp.]